jgi:hypothetical protein
MQKFARKKHQIHHPNLTRVQCITVIKANNIGIQISLWISKHSSLFKEVFKKLIQRLRTIETHFFSPVNQCYLASKMEITKHFEKILSVFGGYLISMITSPRKDKTY